MILRSPITNGTIMNKPMQQASTVYLDRPIPHDDGVTHINTHHKGKHELGRMLSHYYEAPYTHPYFGPFECNEGLWHYLKDGYRDDVFRNLNGHQAKLRARHKMNSGQYANKSIPNVTQVMLLANYAKIMQHPEIKELLMASTLPFDHYYLHGPGELPIRPRGSEWLPNIFADLRKMFNEGTEPVEPNYILLFPNK